MEIYYNKFIYKILIELLINNNNIYIFINIYSYVYIYILKLNFKIYKITCFFFKKKHYIKLNIKNINI
jgi:hypothetical protein